MTSWCWKNHTFHGFPPGCQPRGSPTQPTGRSRKSRVKRVSQLGGCTACFERPEFHHFLRSLWGITKFTSSKKTEKRKHKKITIITIPGFFFLVTIHLRFCRASIEDCFEPFLELSHLSMRTMRRRRETTSLGPKLLEFSQRNGNSQYQKMGIPSMKRHANRISQLKVNCDMETSEPYEVSSNPDFTPFVGGHIPVKILDQCLDQIS